MAHYEERISKDTKERQGIFEKMKPLKEKLKPLQKRYTQLWKNISKTEWERKFKESEENIWLPK